MKLSLSSIVCDVKYKLYTNITVVYSDIYVPYAARVANATMMSVFVLSMFSVLMFSMFLAGPMLSVLLLAFLNLEELSILFYFLHMLLFVVFRTARTARFDIRFGLRLGAFVGVC